ncbi:hypothetical protein DTO271D3_4809 [Paecilomyces variotii]|nr:hypothetical protein DTO271D3_4809 [Paecilomyces variotii]
MASTISLHLLSAPIRASRQGASLFTRHTLSHGRITASVIGAAGKSAYSIRTFSGLNCTEKRRLRSSCAARELNLKRTTPFLQQKRWTTSKKSTEDDASPDSKEESSPKPKLLSRLPIPTHENIYTVPNILTFSRLVAAPVVGYLLVHDYHGAALSLFAYAGITDLIDGYIARRYNLQTVVGTVIDPMADKLLMTISVVCLGLNGSLPAWLAVLILGRDVGLAISALYYRWISLPPPKTMARYWDFSLPSAEVKPTGISKLNTALQLLLVGSAMAIPVVPEAIASGWGLHEGMTALQYIVATTTIWSGLSYVYAKDAVKILTKEEIQKRITRAAALKSRKP